MTIVDLTAIAFARLDAAVSKPEPRFFPLTMTEEAIRARVKAWGMYGEGRTAREWEAACLPWRGGQ